MADERILATYLVETPHSLEFAAEKVAGAVGAGTFTPVPGETEELQRRFAVNVESIEALEARSRSSLPSWTIRPKSDALYLRARVRVSIPLDITGVDLATMLATVAGGVFGLRELTGIRLEDIELPPVFANAHPGPQFGVEGTRRLTGVDEGPIIASIIKPNVGLTPDQTAEIVATLAEAGVDFVKDDEKMTAPPYSTMENRVEAVMRVVNRHTERTGRRVMYAFNITHTNPDVIVRNHEIVARAGGTCVMLSVVQAGLGALAFLRQRCSLPIHAHRNGWDLMTRSPALGWNFRAWQKILRLAGVDHLHVNGIRNKYWEDDDSVVLSVKACLTPMCDLSDRLLPVLGSGMWAGQVPETWQRIQTADVMYIAGGGIQAHPSGPAAGVRSIRQAWDAARAGTPLAEYADNHPELREALEKFGSKEPL